MSDTPLNLADLITAEVARQTSEQSVRELVEKNIAAIIRRVVDTSLGGFGDLNKKIATAVAKSLELNEPLDVPAYGTMVMAALRQQMDAILSTIVNERLATEMREILSVAPAEVKLSEIVAAMKADEDEGDRFGTHVTLIIEESESVPGYKWVFMDPQQSPGGKSGMYASRDRKYACDLQFALDRKGAVFSLKVEGKDAKTTIVMGHLPKYQRMVFAAYACGTNVIIDGDHEADFDTGFGDF